jgi:hypothetical protein
MAATRQPFSGDVTQTINPWTWWIRSFGQFGFININETNAGDPATEQAIVTDIASYGRQLGWISEALDAVVRHANTKSWPKADRDKLDQLKRLVTQVDAIKQGNREEAKTTQIDRLVQAVEDLKRSDAAVFDEVAKRLRRVVGSKG